MSTLYTLLSRRVRSELGTAARAWVGTNGKENFVCVEIPASQRFEAATVEQAIHMAKAWIASRNEEVP